MLSTERWTWVMVVLVAAGGLGGCGGGGQIVGGEVAGTAGDDSAEFLDRVSSLSGVSESDAVSGMLLLLDGKDDQANFAERVESLRQRRIVDPSWSHDASRKMLRGRLAYMIRQACDIEGGVILRLFGPSQRYCLRELQYMRMMGQGTERGEITGMELVAVLNRAEVYIRTGKVLDSAGEID